MPKVSIKSADITFEVNNNETILDAAIRQGLNLPYSCKSGNCSSCVCSILTNEFTGYALLCKSYITSDISIELSNSSVAKNVTAKVIEIIKQNNVAIIKLKLPVEFIFEAGQYIDILFNGKNKSYSIANSPNGKEIEFHIKYYENGTFSDYVWHKLAINEIIRFRGPLGKFKLQISNKPMILVCTGTGFAPIKALLEEIINNNYSREISFYWGNRTKEDFYLLEYVKFLQNKLMFHMKLCLSCEIDDNFEYGYVTDVISRDFADLSNHEVYACGNLKIIEDVYNLCIDTLNLPKEQFYSDAFTPSI